MGLDQYAPISHPKSVNELQNVRERRIVLLHALPRKLLYMVAGFRQPRQISPRAAFDTSAFHKMESLIIFDVRSRLGLLSPYILCL